VPKLRMSGVIPSLFTACYLVKHRDNFTCYPSVAHSKQYRQTPHNLTWRHKIWPSLLEPSIPRFWKVSKISSTYVTRLQACHL